MVKRRTTYCILAVCVGAAAGIAGGRFVIEAFAGSVAIVQGTSMAPNFEPGTRVCVKSFERPLRRGEVVLVEDGAGGYALKRIIGLPREKIHLWRGYVFINGQMLIEPYLPKYTFTHPDQLNQKYAFALGHGCYFVMGDNRLYSADSRTYGPVPINRIVSVVEQGTEIAPEFAPFALPVHGRQTIRSLATVQSARSAL